MITSEKAAQYRDGVYSAAETFFGLSTDTKPTGADVANGSAFIELDAGKLYFYDADGAQWLEWGA